MSIKRETAEERKALPLATGVLDYFPDALLAVAECSRVGNDQHNPGQPLHWAKEKSTDEADALVRHLLDRGTVDSDGVRHSAKVAWRALAMLQRELDAEALEDSAGPDDTWPSSFILDGAYGDLLKTLEAMPPAIELRQLTPAEEQTGVEAWDIRPSGGTTTSSGVWVEEWGVGDGGVVTVVGRTDT